MLEVVKGGALECSPLQGKVVAGFCEKMTELSRLHQAHQSQAQYHTESETGDKH